MRILIACGRNHLQVWDAETGNMVYQKNCQEPKPLLFSSDILLYSYRRSNNLDAQIINFDGDECNPFHREHE